MHKKIILGNRVPIEDDEIMDYVVDEIPDGVLRDQAHFQCFKTVGSILEAFEKISLRDRKAVAAMSSMRSDKHHGVTQKTEYSGKAASDERRRVAR